MTSVDVDAAPGSDDAGHPGWWVLGVAGATLALALCLRIWIVTGDLGTLNADEVISGLMARELLDGDLTVFFWGQAYGGTIETWPLAAAIAVAGPTVAIAALPLLESVVVALLLHRVARRHLASGQALLVAALAMVFPASWVWFSTRPMLFYLPTMILGLGAILVVEQLSTDRLDARARAWRLGLLGVLLGVGWWTSAQILFFAVPVLWWVVSRRVTRSVGDVAVAVGGAVAGASPWIVYQLATGGRSLSEVPEGSGSYTDHLRAQLERGWPMLLGVRRPFDERWVLDGFGPVAAVVGLTAAAWVAWVFVRQRDLRSPLAGVLLAFPLLHALAPGSSFVGNGRYYAFLAPAVAYVVVAAVGTLRRGTAIATAIVVAAGVMTTATLAAVRDVQAGPEGIEEVADVLERLGIDDVYANYWIGYPLAWTDDDVAVSPDHTDRRPDWSARVRDADRAAYVFWLPYGVDADRFADLLPRLEEHVGVTEVVEVGDYRIVVPARNVPPELLPPAGR